jgi:hypothetical protein
VTLEGQELTAAERSLRDAARAGVVCDLSDADRLLDAPAIRGTILGMLCTDPDSDVHWRGIRLHHASVEGDIDLAGANIPFPLELSD